MTFDSSEGRLASVIQKCMRAHALLNSVRWTVTLVNALVVPNDPMRRTNYSSERSRTITILRHRDSYGG